MLRNDYIKEKDENQQLKNWIMNWKKDTENMTSSHRSKLNTDRSKHLETPRNKSKGRFDTELGYYTSRTFEE